MQGEQMTTLLVDNGLVHIRLLLASIEQTVGVAGSLWFEDAVGEHVVTLGNRIGASLHKHAPAWLFNQLVWQLGGLLDDEVHRSVAGEAGDLCAEVAAIDVPIMSGDYRHVNAQLSRYRKASHKILTDAKMISLAPDAAKVGHKSVMLVPAAAADSGICCWLPPQAG